jgi:hypothetical protein
MEPNHRAEDTAYAGGRALPKSKTWASRACLIGAFLFVLGFQMWTLRTSSTLWEKPEGERRDYYNLLARGFLSGHLSLAVDPDPRLVALKDPYLPEARKKLDVLHDVSYFKGRYYLYWGPAPALVAFLPFRALTGHDLPAMYASLAFTSLGFGFLAALYLRLRRDFFPESRTWVAALSVVALGCGSLTLALLRRHSMWELPIASGHCFAMAGLLMAYVGLRSARPWRAWAGSSLCFGLALASRPTYAVGIAAVMVVFFFGLARMRGWSLRAPWPRLTTWMSGIAFGMPCFLIFIGILWYNYARFGNPLEFGLQYQMSGANEIESTHFTFRYAAHNFYLYYLAPAQWGRYFPFVQLIPSPASNPEGYYGMEYTYGLFANMPLTWLALAAPFGWLVVAREYRRAYTVAVAGIAGLFFTVALALLGFWAATQRYMSDFTPALILLAVVGVLVCEALLDRWRNWLAAPIRGLLGVLLVAASAFGMCLSFQLHGLFKFFSPKLYSKVAYTANIPAHLYETAVGETHGPIELTVKFPKEPLGVIEPLLMTGWEFYSDQVYIHYVGPNHIRLGFDHVSRGTKLTEPIELDRSKPHVIQVEMGSLFPPEEHPFFDGVPEAGIGWARNWLRITFDGEVVLDSLQSFYDASPESLRIGTTCYPQVYGKRFTGEVLKVSRPGFKFQQAREVFGETLSLRMAVAPGAKQLCEPLVRTGVGEKVDTLYLRHVGEGRVRFGYEHGPETAWESVEIPVPYGTAIDLEVTMPALSDVQDSAHADKVGGRLVVRVEGRMVWVADFPRYRAELSTLVLGRGNVASGRYVERFQGAFSSVSSKRRSSGDELNPLSLGMAVAFKFIPGKREPLIVWGQAGRADILLLEYVSENSLKFGVDHWGVGMVMSPELTLDPAAVHNLNLRRTALPSGAGSERLEVAINGSVVWTYDGVFYPADPAHFTIGLNRIQASTCSDTFSGAVLRFDSH